MSPEYRIRRFLLVPFVGLALSGLAFSQSLRGAVEDYVEASQRRVVSELWDALGIPAVASDTENIRRKAEYFRERFAERGFVAELIATSGNPLVYAERVNPEASRTLLFYAHYDGQPVDPDKWAQDDPFTPLLRSGKLGDAGVRVLDVSSQSTFTEDQRIYARSSSDDTAPIVALLAAVDYLAFSDTHASSNIRVVLDGEEEAGSPSLVPAIDANRQRLAADLMIILDGPIHPSNVATLVYGARGILTLELTLFGPKFPLHSGHYGNWAPNPAMRLAQLLASMKDDDGRTSIDGFYDGIEIPPEDQAVIDAVPDDLDALEAFLGFSEPDRVGRTLQEALQYPSLNVRGLSSAWVGAQARTIIPATATAAVDVRLVQETDADQMYRRVISHIESRGYHVLTGDQEPDDAMRARHGRLVRVRRGAGSNAFRTPLDEPHAARVVEVLEEMWGVPPVRARTMGGTVPIAPFVDALGLPALTVPTVNYDNNQHSPNENVRLGHFFRSIVSIAAILTM